ncbi:ECF transporter S component, partial [Eubacterium maltosivorans]|uniref:ECF transporter S component n=2 Tax=Eubacteriaceae TaxID=186806 RepID=UPI003A905486
MKKLTTNMLVFMAMAVGLNFVGCFVALVLKLPVYLDSIGTLLSAVLLGPAAGAVVGGLTALINGATIDPVSLYFLPVQVVAGVSTGLLFKNGRFEGLKSVLAIVLVTLFVSVMSSVIVAFVFNGVTSSGSSFIV